LTDAPTQIQVVASYWHRQPAHVPALVHASPPVQASPSSHIAPVEAPHAPEPSQVPGRQVATGHRASAAPLAAGTHWWSTQVVQVPQSAESRQQRVALVAQQSWKSPHRSPSAHGTPPAHEPPVPAVATQAPPEHVYPDAQSCGPPHWVAHAGACSGAAVQATPRYAPQPFTCPSHALSSWTVREPHTYPSQMASCRVPWQSVPGPGVVQVAAAWKDAGQASAVRQHVPERQQ
jgi:hypothetical protein